MPIKPENMKRYPANWASEIRPAIMARANNRCEWPGCGALHRSYGLWKAGMFFRIYENRESAMRARWSGAIYNPMAIQDWVYEGEHLTEIVLTIAHKDHTPENCAPENLAAWCQRHHLAYDQQHHLTNAYMTRKAKAQTQELPL